MLVSALAYLLRQRGISGRLDNGGAPLRLSRGSIGVRSCADRSALEGVHEVGHILLPSKADFTITCSQGCVSGPMCLAALWLGGGQPRRTNNQCRGVGPQINVQGECCGEAKKGSEPVVDHVHDFGWVLALAGLVHSAGVVETKIMGVMMERPAFGKKGLEIQQGRKRKSTP